MAPTRGFRRALIAVAATIIAEGFPFRRRSVSESKPKPAPVLTPTVRAQPVQMGIVDEQLKRLPADSRLLAHYMTPPPEPASVKLRRKANNDAGGAFRRWARRRRKIAPLPDSGATYCGQRPGYICRGHGSEKRCLPDASCK